MGDAEGEDVPLNVAGYCLCPLSGVVMTDPVTARNGETFQREAFERLRRGKRRPGSKEAQILEALGADVTVVFNWFAKKTVEASLEWARSKIDPVEAPDHFRCPVTQEFLEDPVLCSDGHTYERVFIDELHQRYLESCVVNPATAFKSPLSNEPMPDTVFIENKFAKRAMAEFALQFPSLIQREAGALDEYRRWKREREERLAMEEAEEEEDIRFWRPYVVSNKEEAVLHPSPFPPELGEIYVVEVPRRTGTTTDMYFVSEDLTLSAEGRRAARERGQRPTTLRSVNELARHLSGCGYYPGAPGVDEVKRRLEREVTLRKLFEPDKFIGRRMLSRWDDGVWYAVQGLDVIVGARRVVIHYIESGETEEMSYRSFCKIWRTRRLELLEHGEDVVRAAQLKNARARGREQGGRGEGVQGGGGGGSREGGGGGEPEGSGGAAGPAEGPQELLPRGAQEEDGQAGAGLAPARAAAANNEEVVILDDDE